MAEDIWSKQIQELKDYCQAKKWSVVSSAKEDTANWDKKQITLLSPTKRNNETTFYIFLHEVGHMLMQRRSRVYHNKYGKTLEGYGRATLVHRVTRIEEEYEAWRFGYELAKEKRWQVNDVSFERIRAKCIMSYFMWASEKTMKRRISFSASMLQ